LPHPLRPGDGAEELTMAEDDPDSPMTSDDIVSAAEELLAKLREGWREKGFPPEVLAHAMIGAGLADLVNERGAEAVLQLFRDLSDEIEQAARSRPN
jgi:hypothetical protein